MANPAFCRSTAPITLSVPEEKAMTLSETLLQKLSKWKITSRQSLDLSGDGWTVAVSADRTDDLGCLVWDLAVKGATTPSEPVAVRDWAARLVRRATGLLEHLKLLEVDDGRHQALLRSDEPSRRGDDVFYYEILLNGDSSASVRRYRAGRSGGRREQVSFGLTHEALAKLVGDLTAEK
jgi:hypothetical protein